MGMLLAGVGRKQRKRATKAVVAVCSRWANGDGLVQGDRIGDGGRQCLRRPLNSGDSKEGEYFESQIARHDEAYGSGKELERYRNTISSPSFGVSTTSGQPPRPKLPIYASLKRSNRLLPARNPQPLLPHTASILPSIRLASVVIVPAVIAAVLEILLRIIVARHIILVVIVIVINFLIFRREVVFVAGLGHFFVVVGAAAAVGKLFEEVAGALGGFVGGGGGAVVGAEGGFFGEGGEVEFLLVGVGGRIGGGGCGCGLRVEGCPELLREEFEDYVRLSENNRRNDPKAL